MASTSASADLASLRLREARSSPLHKGALQVQIVMPSFVSMAGGVKNATHRYDLPPPPLAVRNLVCPLNCRRK